MISQHNMISATSTETDTVAEKEPKPPEMAQKNPDKTLPTILLKKQQKAMRRFKCTVKGCPLRFNRDEVRKKHENCHVDQQKKQFMCPVCKEKFSMWRICNTHMWKNHSIDLGLLSCPVCNEFKANSSIRVINHMAIHNEEKPFICTACGKGFKQVAQLKNHEVMHKGPDEVSDSYKKKQCEHCHQYFANSKCLKKHIKFVHDKFKPFICNICGHKTARKATLQLHYRQHTGDKPFVCSYCEYKTADKNCLRKHTMRHFRMGKYSCPYCKYQSIQASAYKIHLASKHPGKEGTYSCSLCRYTTVNCRSYMAHVKYHELEKKKTNGTIDWGKQEDEGGGEQESKEKLPEDEETQNCFLNTEHSEEAVDTGGITIPASFDLQLNNDQTNLV